MASPWDKDRAKIEDYLRLHEAEQEAARLNAAQGYLQDNLRFQRPGGGQYAPHLGVLGAAERGAYGLSPVSGAGSSLAQAASPYTRVTNPYSGLAEAQQARAAYAAQVAGGALPGDESAISALWSAQQRQQAAHYAAAAAAGAYGGVGREHGFPGSVVSQQEQLALMQHHQAAAQYNRERGKYHEQQQQWQNKESLQTPVRKSPSFTPSSAPNSPHPQTASSTKSPIGNHSKSPTKSPTKSKPKTPKKESPGSERKAHPMKPPKRAQEGSTIITEDGSQNWYTGCVPLGLDDDKYWLSELQVYLRANFAEAFGATEEDIAAPMHGRNKPIALGQVGIRCMHCKSKSKEF